MQFSQPMDLICGPNRLTGSKPNQFPDDDLTKSKREKKGSDRRRDRAERHIAKDIQPFDLLAEEMEVIHHGVTPAAD